MNEQFAPPPPPPVPGDPGSPTGRRARPSWRRRLLALLVVLGIAWIGWTFLRWMVFGPSVSIPDGSWIQVRFAEDYPEARPEPGGLRDALIVPPLSAQELLFAFHRLEKDPRVEGVLVEPDGFPGGWGQAHELRATLRSLREHGKQVWAYVERPGSIDYYLASAAETIITPSEGQVEILGLDLRMSYLKNTLDKLGVEADFVAVGEYKSAPEQFTQDQPSEASRAQAAAWLDDVYSAWSTALSEARGLTMDRLSLLLHRAPLDAQTALAEGLVDLVRERQSLWEEDEGPELISVGHYLDAIEGETAGPGGPRVGLIYIEGTIVTGASGVDRLLGPVAGSDTIVERLEQARREEDVAALVVRVDSPGGSALASDLIYRELKRVQQHKPVLVSMADVSASGGYYVGMSADRVLANPLSLTGSIGVYSGKLHMAELYEKLGLSFETLQRGENADLYSELHPFSTEQRIRLRERLEAFYARFVERVAEGRDLPLDEADRAARGRIWTGRRAVEVGLVDELGGLALALRRAREAAGLEPDGAIAIRVYQDEPGWLDRMLRRLFTESTMVQGVLGEETPLSLLPVPARRSLGLLRTLDGSAQFHLPWSFELR